MNVAVLIPYSDSDLRRPLLSLVQAHLRPAGWPLVVAGKGYPFNRSASINRAAVDASADELVDVYVVNDADTLVPLGQIEQAVALAEQEPGLVYCHRSYFRLTREQTQVFVALSEHGVAIDIRPTEDSLLAVAECEWHQRDAPSLGCMAIRRDCFERVGGFDERFSGWGYEDLAFRAACERLWPTRRVPGDLYHLWHGKRRQDDSPLEADPADVGRNLHLYEAEYA